MFLLHSIFYNFSTTKRNSRIPTDASNTHPRSTSTATPIPHASRSSHGFSGYKTCAVLPAVKAQALQDTKFHVAATIPEKNNSKNPHIHHTGSKKYPAGKINQAAQ